MIDLNDVNMRSVTKADLESVTQIERLSFPKEEAATREAFEYRINAFPEAFVVALMDGKIIGHVNGCCTDLPTICDELFEPSGGHKADGKNQMIFGLAVHPDYRRQGIAEMLMNALIERSKLAKRKQVVLTCKAHLIKYYERFGFVSLGVSESTHGGAVWYDMVLRLN